MVGFYNRFLKALLQNHIFFRAACSVILLRNKLHKKLPSVIVSRKGDQLCEQYPLFKTTLYGHFRTMTTTASKYTRDFLKFSISILAGNLNDRKDLREDKFSRGG